MNHSDASFAVIGMVMGTAVVCMLAATIPRKDKNSTESVLIPCQDTAVVLSTPDNKTFCEADQRLELNELQNGKIIVAQCVCLKRPE